MTEAARQFAADTHTGLQRQQNEDCFEADADAGFWLVADGIGGHAYGEVASDIVRRTATTQVAAGNSLVNALIASHHAILDAIAEQNDAKDMGSTAVALRVLGEEYDIAWIGDSRAYLWDGRLTQLTEDHSQVAELLANKQITAEEASAHPLRHVLTQALGVSNSMEVHPGHVSGKLGSGQHILLCSDGLTDELSDSLIAHLLQEHRTPRAQVDALMSAALDAGGRDNITVVIVGECQSSDAHANPEDVDNAHSSRRSATGGRPNDGRFPLRTLLLLSVLAMLAALFLV